ncbi:hypothetical protein K466DRAFT_458987, partial [Polyporus arcularius HHB13444]
TPHFTGAHAASDTPPRSAKRRYTREADKLDMILDFIHDEMGWTLGDFLYAVFNFGDGIHRAPKHASSVSSFLQGGMKRKPSEIIDLWMRHPDG